MVNDVLASGIGPEQFRDIWHRTVERSGEQTLMLAMVEQAVDDLGHYRTARRPEHQRIFDQTYRWLAANDRTWPYSFACICKMLDRKSTRLNSSHRCISYAVFCLKKKNNDNHK